MMAGLTGVARSRDIDVTSKDIDGITDLVVWAPIKEGFIDAFNNVTYETRLHLVAEALHSLRKSAREYEKLEPFADTAKRIISLLDFRIGVVDRDLRGPAQSASASEARSFRPRKYMYLVASFDGPWEPYMRLIYNPLGTFLDLVLCNCEGYKPALETDFETYAQWVRDNQLDSAIFYSTSGQSVGDKIYFEELDRIQRSKSAATAADEISRLTLKRPDEEAESVRNNSKTFSQSLKLGLEALNVLYKLTDYYPPNKKDGEYLFYAAQDLLLGLPDLVKKFEQRRQLPETLKQPYEWFRNTPVERKPREIVPQFDKAQIQKGVLSSYDGPDFKNTHGALLLVRIDDPELFQEFLRTTEFSWENQPQPIAQSEGSSAFRYFLNIAFSMRGLEKLEVPETELGRFPKEFREGMERRASLIGDKFDNHPRSWTLPKRGFPLPGQKAVANTPIELSEIDCVLQLRGEIGNELSNAFLDFEQLGGKHSKKIAAYIENAESPNFTELLDKQHSEIPKEFQFAALIKYHQLFGSERSGFTVLGIESMFRPYIKPQAPDGPSDAAGNTSNNDHFGFRDGISQPIVKAGSDVPDSSDHPMSVLRGEVLYGFPNNRFDQHREEQKKRLMFNGSFLAVRKIKQNTNRFQALEADLQKKGLGAELLVGRAKNGEPLVERKNADNSFTYKNDSSGDACPLSAHIRLANPRNAFHKRPAPKIVRRGMSYGPAVQTGVQDDEERGIIFMAYCASLAEQYEVIQRWLNGGNATGVSASRNDPLTGALGRSESGGHMFSVRVNGKPSQIKVPEPLTKLEWGSYFFVPSKTALQRLSNTRTDPEFVKQRWDELNARGDEGRRIIKEIEALPQAIQQDEWKKIIEDFLVKDPTEYDKTPRVWQAIEENGGIHRIESGIAFDRGNNDPNPQSVVLVTNEKHILNVLGEGKTYPKNAFSSSEQYSRINRGFGTIYVCLDDNATYYKEAQKTNDVLLRYSREAAAIAGYRAGKLALKDFNNRPNSKYKLELGRQFIQPALAELCKYWYGIPDGVFIEKGGWNWNENRAPVCPGDFLSTSRQTFYPRPTSTIQEFGETHGTFLKDEGIKYVRSIWAQDPVNDPIDGTIARQVHKIMRDEDRRDPGNTEYYQSLMLRNIIGGMVGAIPPMDSCLRWALFDWLREKTLWDYQTRFLEQLGKIGSTTRKKPKNYQTELAKIASAVLEPGLKTAMCLRPAPDLLYRTVAMDGIEIGGHAVNRGDLVILCLSAATQNGLSKGNNDVSVVFGGNRKAPGGGQDPKAGLHSCPAKDLAMGAMTGILASLLEVGTIKAMPASLIVEIEA